jgi:NAD(P)-dependent dehydrogenase (short-subunit alcohol dehydrogenase family)
VIRLQGRRALVTGGGSGIGRGIASRLLAEGCLVTIVDVSADNIQETLGLLEVSAGHLFSMVADVSDGEQVAAAVEASRVQMGGIDILVNNAAITIRRPAIDLSEAEWDRVIDINLKGYFLVAQAVARVMRAGGGGAIVNLSSTTAEVVRAGLAAYASSKGAIRQLTKVLAVEWGEYHIRVNAIGPGGILTPVTEPIVREKGEQWYMGKMPRGRMGKPSDIAAAVVFLASDEADFITGTTLYVEGGVLAVDPREPVRQPAAD